MSVNSRLRLQRLRNVALVLCAWLALFGTPWPTDAGDAKPLTAILLVARAELPDFNFRDSIVLALNNIGPAPAGLIINRPTKIAVSRLFPDVERLARLQDRVYFGGPVEVGSVWFLFRADAPRDHAIQVFDGVYVSADRELLLRLLGRDKPMDGLRIFIGHCGWAPGQLETEVAHGDWTLAPAGTEAIFHGKSEHPWPAPSTPDGAEGT